jgi:hypothetical protein
VLFLWVNADAFLSAEADQASVEKISGGAARHHVTLDARHGLTL